MVYVFPYWHTFTTFSCDGGDGVIQRIDKDIWDFVPGVGKWSAVGTGHLVNQVVVKTITERAVWSRQHSRAEQHSSSLSTECVLNGHWDKPSGRQNDIVRDLYEP